MKRHVNKIGEARQSGRHGGENSEYRRNQLMLQVGNPVSGQNCSKPQAGNFAGRAEGNE